jgi:hypothetical protein
MTFSVYALPQPTRQDRVDYSAVGNAFDALCKHRMVARYEIRGNGARVFKEQCASCGKSGIILSANHLTEAQRNRAEPFSQADAKAYDLTRSANFDACIQDAKAASDRAWWAWYNRYLLSPVWQAKRQAVLKRASGICEACLSATAAQVHHLTYLHVGSEPLFDLVAVCESCHKQLTEA